MQSQRSSNLPPTTYPNYTSTPEDSFITSIVMQFSVFLRGIVKYEPKMQISENVDKQPPQLSQKNGITARNPTEKPERSERRKGNQCTQRRSFFQRQPIIEPSSQSQSDDSIPSIEIIPSNSIERSKITPSQHIDEEQSEDEEYRTPKKSRKRRNRHRDPNNRSPKKPISSFVHFYAARAKQLREQCPQGIVGNLAKILSAQWKTLSDKEKVPFIKAAEQSLQTYYNEKKLEKQEQKQKRLEEANKRQEMQKKLEQENQEKRKDSTFSAHNHVPEQTKEKQIPKQPEEKTMIKPTLTNKEEPPQENKGIQSCLSAFHVYFKINQEKLSKKYNQNNKAKLTKIAQGIWNQMTGDDKRVYINMAKVERRKRYKMQQMRKIEHESHRKMQDKFGHKKRTNHREQEYKPNIYRKSRAKHHEPAIKDDKRQESDHQDQNDDVNLPSFEFNQHFVKQEPDRSCQLRNLMEEQDLYPPLHDNLDRIQEISQNCSDNGDKGKSYHYPLPVQFIQVSENDDQCAFFENTLTKTRKRERELTFDEYKKEKTPVNAFLIYYQETLRELKTKHEKVQGSQLVKMASSRWSALNESEKLAYYNLARERKKKYDDFVTNDQTEVDLTRSRNRQRKIEAIL